MQKKGIKLKEERRKRGPNLTEPPPELRNEREGAGRRKKKSFSSVNPREGKTNKRTIGKKLGKAQHSTHCPTGKNVHKTLKNPCLTKDGKKEAEPHRNLANH